MTELTRSLLASAREGLSPDAAAAARVRARVAAAVAKPAAGSAGVLLKLGAVAVVAAVVTGAVAMHRDSRVESPRISAPSAQLDIGEPTSTIATHESHAPASVRTNARVRVQEPASLAREVELLDQAMTSLRLHDPAAALTAIATFERETLGQAQMAEEAAAISIEAHCAQHDDVIERIDAFDRTWPNSAERARITAACR